MLLKRVCTPDAHTFQLNTSKVNARSKCTHTGVDWEIHVVKFFGIQLEVSHRVHPQLFAEVL